MIISFLFQTSSIGNCNSKYTRNVVNDGSIINIIKTIENCTKIASHPDEFKHNDKVSFAEIKRCFNSFCLHNFSFLMFRLKEILKQTTKVVKAKD